jgi:hypothetical protein
MSGITNPHEDGFHEATSGDYEDFFPNVTIIVCGEARLTEQEGTLRCTVDAFIERVNDLMNEAGIEWWVDTCLVKEGDA